MEHGLLLVQVLAVIRMSMKNRLRVERKRYWFEGPTLNSPTIGQATGGIFCIATSIKKVAMIYGLYQPLVTVSLFQSRRRSSKNATVSFLPTDNGSSIARTNRDGLKCTFSLFRVPAAR